MRNRNKSKKYANGIQAGPSPMHCQMSWRTTHPAGATTAKELPATHLNLLYMLLKDCWYA